VYRVCYDLSYQPRHRDSCGTEIISAPREIKRFSPFGEAFVSVGPRGYASLVIDDEALKNRSDLFTPVTV